MLAAAENKEDEFSGHYIKVSFAELIPDVDYVASLEKAAPLCFDDHRPKPKPPTTMTIDRLQRPKKEKLKRGNTKRKKQREGTYDRKPENPRLFNSLILGKKIR